MLGPIFGVAYYPEHWPEDRWPQDARMMRAAGINTVRLGEFAWSRLEPAKGTFTFDWLDRAITLLQEEGMRIVLGTPTAAPPAWLIQEEPEILPVNEEGQRAVFGTRRHYCPSHPAFHAATCRIVSAMAARYAEHPAVFAWQIDNELGSISNGNRCHCAVCRAAFGAWLHGRYGTLEALNRQWGTVFWSQEYTDWAQIPTPMQRMRGEGNAHNPALYLDFARFSSESWVRYQAVQLRILRERCSGHLITHNMMGLYPFVDCAALAEPLDLVSWDNYPRMPAPWSPLAGGWSPTRVAQAHDLMRGVKGRPFWVMEQQAGPSGWSLLSPSPLPGELRLWTLQAIARGAEGIVYFRWRTGRFGTEQFWHGILPHDGSPGRRYEEISRVGREVHRLGGLVGAALPVKVALLRSYDTLWALMAQPMTTQLGYDDQIDRYYRALWRQQVPVDLISEDRPLAPYRLVIAPCLFVVSDALAKRLRDWVESGGTLVLTFRSGVKDAHNCVIDAPLPGPFAELAGVTVRNYTTLLPAGSGTPSTGDATVAFGRAVGGADTWLDDLTPTAAEVLATYQGGPYAGNTAITVHRFGAGAVVYVGTSLDDTGQNLLRDHLLHLAGVPSGPAMPEGVEAIRRTYEGVTFWFLLNHGSQSQEIQLPDAGTDLLTGRVLRGNTIIDGLDALVLRVEEGSVS